MASAFYIDEACSEKLSEDRASSRPHETDVFVCHIYTSERLLVASSLEGC
jgi:hypothetical protein